MQRGSEEGARSKRQAGEMFNEFSRDRIRRFFKESLPDSRNQVVQQQAQIRFYNMSTTAVQHYKIYRSPPPSHNSSPRNDRQHSDLTKHQLSNGQAPALTYSVLPLLEDNHMLQCSRIYNKRHTTCMSTTS